MIGNEKQAASNVAFTGLNLFFFCSGFQVLDSGFCQCNLGFRIPIASTIPDSLSCSPDSKNIAFHKRKFLGFQNPDSLTSLFFRETDHDLSTKTNISLYWRNLNSSNNHSNHICRRSRGTSTQIRKLKAENLNVSEFLIFFFFFWRGNKISTVR